MTDDLPMKRPPGRRRQVIASALVLAAVAVAFYASFIIIAVTRG